ncbi:MAG TPA: HEAT repeat domain-containing protein [Candidatus Altiarchaeales archaeon]|nr:HEAT repeat domain-containing protein [Candidatus Altiarchaeales archaeon]
MKKHRQISSGIPKPPDKEIQAVTPHQLGQDEFDRIVRVFIDQMGATPDGARKAAQRKWKPETVDQIQKTVESWNKVLGVEVKTSFEERGAGIKDGELNFTQRFAEEVLQSPNFIVGHECGHEIERQNNPQAEGTTRGLQLSEAHINPGFDEKKGKYSCPPFGATLHHDRDLRAVFDRTYVVVSPTGETSQRNYLQDIGYNARQIYADSVPFKTVMLQESRRYEWEPKAPVSMEELMTECCGYLERFYNQVSRQIREENTKLTWLGLVPDMARYAATAWGLQKVAQAWIRDPSKSRELNERLDGFTKRFGALLTEPERGLGVSLTEDEAKSLIVMPQAEYAGPTPTFPTQAGLTNEETMAVGVLTRAYKEHFINCLSRRELFEGERLEPHLEKLASPDEYIIRREAYTLGEIGHVNGLQPLLNLLEAETQKSPVEGEHAVIVETISTAVSEIIKKNAESRQAKDALPKIEKQFKSQDKKVRMAMVEAAGAMGEFSSLNKLEELLNDDAELEVRQQAFLAIIDIIGKHQPDTAVDLIGANLEKAGLTFQSFPSRLIERLRGLAPKTPAKTMRIIAARLKNPLDAYNMIGEVEYYGRLFPDEMIEAVNPLLDPNSTPLLGEYSRPEEKGLGIGFLAEIGKSHPDKILPLLIHYAQTPDKYPLRGAIWHVNNRIGWALGDVGIEHPRQVCAELDKLLDVESSYVQTVTALAFERLSKKHADVALKTIDNALKSTSKIKKINALMALGFVGKTRPSESLKRFAENLGVEGDNFSIGHGLGVLGETHPDKLIEFYNQHVGDSKNAREILLTSIGIMGQEHPEQALEILKKEAYIVVKNNDPFGIQRELPNVLSPMGFIARAKPNDVVETALEFAEHDDYAIQVAAVNLVPSIKKKDPETAEKIMAKLRKKMFNADSLLQAFETQLKGVL